MSDDYIVSPFRKRRTPVIGTSPIRDMVCRCGNRDPDKFLTVTSLAGSTLRGFVCAVCENNAEPFSRT